MNCQSPAGWSIPLPSGLPGNVTPAPAEPPSAKSTATCPPSGFRQRGGRCRSISRPATGGMEGTPGRIGVAGVSPKKKNTQCLEYLVFHTHAKPTVFVSATETRTDTSSGAAQNPCLNLSLINGQVGKLPERVVSHLAGRGATPLLNPKL